MTTSPSSPITVDNVRRTWDDRTEVTSRGGGRRSLTVDGVAAGDRVFNGGHLWRHILGGARVTERHAPFGLERERHVELQGRSRHVWQRRVGLVLATAVPVLALFDVFGQRASFSNGESALASVRVDSPSHVRGGLIFTTKIVITPHARLHDAQLWLASGWFQGMTFNGLAPQPSSESANGQWEVYDYGALSAGTPFPVYLSWQVNPTTVGRHSQSVALHDGGAQVVFIPRTITVFP